MLIRQVMLRGADAPTDLRATAGRIVEIGPSLPRRAGEEVHEAGGALAIPGLWDQHVHAGQTAQGYARLDTAGAASTAEIVARVAAVLGADPVLVGFGHRLVDLAGEPTVAALDAVGGDRVPVVLIGGDAHHAWMSSAALAALGLPPRAGIVAEDEWFDAVARLEELPGVAAGLEAGIDRLQEDALSRGLVGLTDMEWGETWSLWRRRDEEGRVRMRVRTATYASGLPAVPGPTGTVLGPSGLVTMGPLKVIADGSLGSRSAYCRHAGGPVGVLSDYALELPQLLTRAAQLGLEPAIHAIGDAAVGVVLDAFAVTGARGRIEHAQLLADEDVARMARLGVRASVQPAHLLDDRDPTEELMPGAAHLAYRFRDLLAAGVPLLFGSDAPVAPVDPWLAMAAAVHRSADEREAWHPEQALQPHEALLASTDGIDALRVGGPADVVLLAEDPFEEVPSAAAAREAAARLREVRPLATIVAARG
ncbi:amidohydrolase [Brachybacterium sp. J153]|uniref:amidohydrolase n=1 Tax=Brachybacterium sp. J153 TaxID=3116488 RepID=UPI002E78EAFD|nr:amidohydrolase family protein [Brachybacterium sp. J153]MEE1619341.1 amidohydrolase family protein [Brachybacterium sp. J153]